MMTPLEAAKRAVLNALLEARRQLNEPTYDALIAALESELASERERISHGSVRARRAAR
jgi:hypothetical protein